MTKVNITVTKSYEDVPKELEKQFSNMAEKLKEMLTGIRTMERATSYGFPADSICDTIVRLSREIDGLRDMFQDAYNISNSYGKLEIERKEKEKEEELLRKIEEYKLGVKEQVENIQNQNLLYQTEIRKLQATIKDMSSQNEKTLPKASSPSKKSSKTKTVKKK